MTYRSLASGFLPVEPLMGSMLRATLPGPLLINLKPQKPNQKELVRYKLGNHNDPAYKKGKTTPRTKRSFFCLKKN